MFKASNIHYELSERTRGVGVGGIGAIHKLALESGLVEAIDESVDVLKVHLPYHESDHVLNIAYNIMSGGTCLEDIELLRNDEVYLDALGAQRIPDPTTGGDFCRRFDEEDINALMEAFNGVRRRIWSCQPEEFFDEAKTDADGTLLETLGECKEGMHISYKGVQSFARPFTRRTIAPSIYQKKRLLRIRQRHHLGHRVVSAKRLQESNATR